MHTSKPIWKIWKTKGNLFQKYQHKIGIIFLSCHSFIFALILWIPLINGFKNKNFYYYWPFWNRSFINKYSRMKTNMSTSERWNCKSYWWNNNNFISIMQYLESLYLKTTLNYWIDFLVFISYKKFISIFLKRKVEDTPRNLTNSLAVGGEVFNDIYVFFCDVCILHKTITHIDSWSYVKFFAEPILQIFNPN